MGRHLSQDEPLLRWSVLTVLADGYRDPFINRAVLQVQTCWDFGIAKGKLIPVTACELSI